MTGGRILVFGGTDLTAVVLARLNECGMPAAGLVTIADTFKISYASGQMTNARHVDLSGAIAPGTPVLVSTDNAHIEEFVRGRGFDVALVAGWYHLVPRRVRELFSLGCFGLHASLLPKLRGGAPLNWAILNGDKSTGVSFFELTDGVDDGPLIGQAEFLIDAEDNIADLVAKSQAATRALVGNFAAQLKAGQIQRVEQVGAPSYCLQRFPEDGRIDWTRPAVEIERLVRAVTKPYPGAFSVINSQRVFFWSAKTFNGAVVHGSPGQLTTLPQSAGIVIVTGDGALELCDATDENSADVLPFLRTQRNKKFDERAI